MTLETVLILIKNNISTLRQFGVETLAVFGSMARQEASTESDIDLLVTFNTSPTFDQYIETRFFLEDLLGCHVDLVIQDDLKPLVRNQVEKEAIYVT